MSKQQLYINDVAVDMPSEEIKIKVASNILADADKVMTAHSYNIALPRTMNNDNIFALAYAPTADTGGKTTHTYLKASLHVDGVPLFVDGQAVLTSVGDKGYNINLFWGLLGIFDKIKEEDLDLCDLPMSKYYPYPANTDGLWIKLTEHFTVNAYNSGMNTDIYNGLDSDSKELADKYPWGLFVYEANDLLNFITDVYGLTLDISPIAQQRIDKLRHPLTTLKSLADGEKVIINLKGAWNYWQGDGRYYIGFQQPTMLDPETIDFASYPFVTNVHSATEKWQANNAISIAQDNIANPYRSRVFNRTKISVEKVRVYGTINTPLSFDVMVNNDTQTSHASSATVQSIDYTWQEGFDVNETQPFIWLDPSPQQSASASSGINLNVEITINKIGDIGTTQWWNNIRNYPQMGVIDYLSELLAHIGGVIVGSVNVPNQLRIMTFDEIAQRSAVNYDVQGVESISMTLDDLAQKNNYTHKENDDAGLPYDASGVIYTNDATLKIERKAYDSKFKVPRNTIVRLWEIENDSDGNKAKWNGGSDYICGWDEDANICRNTGQDFARTIASYYIGYESAVNRPKVVEVKVKLSILELLAFDFARPVYINQLGRSYLVESIESDKSDIYKLTLIQI